MKRMHIVSQQKMMDLANDIGALVIRSGLSYNQAEKIFQLVLERMKDVPYQSALNPSNKE